jgi:hypothetical protein
MPGLLLQAHRHEHSPGATGLVAQGRAALRRRRLPAATIRCLVALGLAVAALWAGRTLLGAGGGATIDRVYTVAEMLAGLDRQPDAWLGRVVRVRGMALSSGCLAWDAGGSAPCRDRAAYLLGGDGASVLQVTGHAPDPLVAALRRLPLVGRLVPGPLVVRWGALATYQVRLQVAPAAVCDASPCYGALLLDAAP